MGRYLERNIANAVATFYLQEGHHFVYERWREILGVIVAETRGRPDAPEEAATAGLKRPRKEEARDPL